MDRLFQKLKTVMGLLLLCLAAIIGLLGKAVFFPEPEKPVQRSGFCGTEDLYPSTSSEGSSLFKNNCARCHNMSDAKLVGPGLAHVYNRVPQPPEKWLRAFISNADSLYKTGDPYQKALRKQFKKEKSAKNYHLPFLFTEQEWTDLLAFLKKP